MLKNVQDVWDYHDGQDGHDGLDGLDGQLVVGYEKEAPNLFLITIELLK